MLKFAAVRAAAFIYFACELLARADASVGAAGAAPPPGGPWCGVAARHGVRAAWSEGHVRVSRGARFADALDGPGEVAAAAISDDGTVYAARGGRLGALAPDGRETWRALPFDGEPAALAAGSGQLAWAARDGERYRVALSRDGGRSWRARTIRRTRSLPDPIPCGCGGDSDNGPSLWGPSLLAVAIEGDVVHLLGAERGCLPVQFQYRRAGGRWSFVRDDEDALAVPGLGAGGVAYGIDTNRAGEIVRFGGGLVARVDGLGWDDLRVAGDGAVTWLAGAGKLLRVEGGAVATVDQHAPPHLRSLAADGDALFAADEEHLFAWSRRDGWRLVAP